MPRSICPDMWGAPPAAPGPRFQREDHQRRVQRSGGSPAARSALGRGGRGWPRSGWFPPARPPPRGVVRRRRAQRALPATRRRARAGPARGSWSWTWPRGCPGGGWLGKGPPRVRSRGEHASPCRLRCRHRTRPSWSCGDCYPSVRRWPHTRRDVAAPMRPRAHGGAPARRAPRATRHLRWSGPGPRRTRRTRVMCASMHRSARRSDRPGDEGEGNGLGCAAAPCR